MPKILRWGHIVTVLNLKGGVGKTHAAWLLASVCQERGLRCLLIDTDPQGNLSNSFARDRGQQPGVERLLDPSREPDILSLIRRTAYRDIDIVPSSPDVARFDLADQKAWEAADLHLSFREPVRHMKALYDFIVFDCPPRLSLASFASLCASDAVVVPLESADWGAQGIVQVSEAIRLVQSRYNRGLELLGYLVSRFKARRTYQQTYLASLREHFGGNVFDTVIPDLAGFERAVTDAVPLTCHAPTSPAADIARAFFDEVCERLERLGRGEGQGSVSTNDRHTDAPSAAGECSSPDGSHEGLTRLRGAYLVLLDQIRPDPSQPRVLVEDDSLRELADSIRRHGVLQPIAVRYLEKEGHHQIISGERRFQAAKLAGLREIPCWIKSPDEDDILVQQLVENWQRLELQPLELARALARLRDAQGMNQQQLAESTGKSKGEVSKLLSLLADLSDEVQKEVGQAGASDVTKRHLLAVARLPAGEQQAAVREIREKKLTATDAETLVAARASTRGGARTVPRLTKFQYTCGQATVVVTFRRFQVALTDVLEALDSARSQAVAVKPELNIIRQQSPNDVLADNAGHFGESFPGKL